MLLLKASPRVSSVTEASRNADSYTTATHTVSRTHMHMHSLARDTTVGGPHA